jgi:hypothetical protein
VGGAGDETEGALGIGGAVVRTVAARLEGKTALRVKQQVEARGTLGAEPEELGVFGGAFKRIQVAAVELSEVGTAPGTGAAVNHKTPSYEQILGAAAGN